MKLLFFFLIFFNVHSAEVNSCDIEIKYRVEDSTNGKSNGKIFITIVNGSDPMVLNLFDEHDPGKGFLMSKDFKNYQTGKEILVFHGLKPSSFIVRIDNEKCKTSISGMDGIIIN